ncbi:MAG: hypothetical protein V3T31_09760, partial [candidate division Zixibacteria bacterium]
MSRISATLIALILLMTSSVMGRLRINEVMVNEPGSATSLEFFELFNDAATDASLAFYQVRLNGNVIDIPVASVSGDDYLIVCKDATAFEAQYGDGSGLWGDGNEAGTLVETSTSFQLSNNAPGLVEVDFVLQGKIDSLTWTSSGVDGVSWERNTVADRSISASVSRTGSTPGFINSVTPIGDDLSLESVHVADSETGSLISLTVRNRGVTTISGHTITLFRFNPVEPSDQSLTISQVPVPWLDTGYSTIVAI